jgi:hypothetical protein
MTGVQDENMVAGIITATISFCANVCPDEKKAGLEPAKNHTLRG